MRAWLRNWRESCRLAVDGVVVVATLGLAWVLFLQRGRPWSEGDEVRASFLFISPDARSAECAADLRSERYRCRFDAARHRDTRTGLREVRPLNGTRGMMVLDGIFEQAKVAQRVAEDRVGQPRASYRWIRADCTLRLLRRLQNVKARWQPGRWSEFEHAWLAAVLDCELGE